MILFILFRISAADIVTLVYINWHLFAITIFYESVISSFKSFFSFGVLPDKKNKGKG